MEENSQPDNVRKVDSTDDELVDATRQVISDERYNLRATHIARQLDSDGSKAQHRDSASDIMLLVSAISNQVDRSDYTQDEIKKELLVQLSEVFNTDNRLDDLHHN